MALKMKYAGIQENDIADGVNGICVSFWVSGCPFHCDECHNKDLWDFNYGSDLPDDYLQKIDKSLTANGINRNLSILGGEPLCKENRQLIKSIVEHMRQTYQKSKTVTIWTGYTYEELLKENDTDVDFILKNIDILIDGRYEKDLRDLKLKLRGSSNQRILHLENGIISEIES